LSAALPTFSDPPDPDEPIPKHAWRCARVAKGSRELNADNIREMHLAFRRGGRAAINKVMKQQPAVFLKLLVLLVPREMKIEHSGGR
jgi:hypothetical protein